MTDETDRRGIAAIGWGKQTALGTPVTGDLSWWERFVVAPAFRDGKLIEVSLVSDDKTELQPEAMSHERLAAIHGRLALISAWPWRLDERHIADTNHVYSAPGGERQWLVAGTPRIPIRPRSKEQSLLDAEFIAHAPEDIDALLTEMEQLREQNAQLRAELDDALRDLADCEAEL